MAAGTLKPTAGLLQRELYACALCIHAQQNQRIDCRVELQKRVHPKKEGGAAADAKAGPSKKPRKSPSSATEVLKGLSRKAHKGPAKATEVLMTTAGKAAAAAGTAATLNVVPLACVCWVWGLHLLRM